MAATQPTTSCRSLFKQFEMTPVQWQYTLSSINFIINNQKNFQMNSSTHNINTRNKLNLHRPKATKSCFQKSTIYAGIKIFKFPHSLTILKNDKEKFTEVLGIYINTHSLYSVDEFFMCKNDL
jgi:hypothetical protein